MDSAFTSFGEFKRRYPIRPNEAGSLLGSGSYGRVIKVEDQLETEWVAIKMGEFKGNDTKSLKAEVELAQRVPRQANIARYDACYRLETDTGVSDFAIMKYYPDGNLADLLRRVTLTPAQIYDITRGILLGLQHLHRHRIVHRDFKPANILISRDNAGRFIPKIADFGLSKLVTDDELDHSDFDLSDGRGTPSYKAPEQIEGSRVSFNLDLWAFGVILYEMMTGEKPFRAESRNSSEQSVRRTIETKIMSVDLPARLGQVDEPYQSMIRRCLVRDIHQRVRKAEELLNLLDRIPSLLTEAQAFFDRQQYDEALGVYERVLAKRENHAEAQRGITACKAAIETEYVAQLLREADKLLMEQLPDQAEPKYEQALRLAPALPEAISGLARCVAQLQPRPLSADPELTDVYEEDKTDQYVMPSAPVLPKPLIGKESVTAERVEKRPVDSAPARPNWIGILPIKSPPSRTFTWRIAVPVAAVLCGLALYFKPNETPATGTGQTQGPTAGVTPSVVGPEPSEVSESVGAESTKGLGDAKAALNKRINIALGKARLAYRHNDYDQAIMLSKSALGLDATRQDVAALRDAAVSAKQKAGLAGPVGLTAAPVETPQPISSAPEAVKPAVTEPDPKEVAAAAKKEAQANYDQLIDEGTKAIANGNNKAKAMAAFGKAQALAKEHELNTAKGDAAFSTYLNKANKIFDTDAFEGAKGWYLVAQSLKDTPEVQRQIKRCTMQNQ